MSHVWFFLLCFQAQVQELSRLSDRIVDMHRRNQEKLPEMMSVAFEHNNVGQVRQFEKFRQDMRRSFCLQRARTSRAYLPFVINRTPGEDIGAVHNYLKQGVIFEGVSNDLTPSEQQFLNLDLNTLAKEMRSHEDRTVLMCWNPPLQKDVATTDQSECEDGSGGGVGGTVERQNILRCRHVRDVKTMMLMPLIMTWSFEKSTKKMKNQLQSMQELDTWYRTECGNSGAEIGAELDQRAWCALLTALELFTTVGELLFQNTKNTKNTKNIKKEEIEKCCTLFSTVATQIDSLSQQYVDLMAMDGGNTSCLEPSSVGLLSRFIRIDAIVIALLLHSLHRELPTELTKATKKKSKKSKKNKGKSGSGSGSSKKHALEGVRSGIVMVGNALLRCLQRMKTKTKSLLPKLSDVETGVQCLFGLDEQLDKNDTANIVMSLVTLERKKFVAKQLLTDWHAAFDSLGQIIDDRVQVILRLPGVDPKGKK